MMRPFDEDDRNLKPHGQHGKQQSCKQSCRRAGVYFDPRTSRERKPRTENSTRGTPGALSRPRPAPERVRE